MRTTIALLSFLPFLASATPAPAYPGYKLLWSDTFRGDPGQTPDQGKWNIMTDVHTNGEVQTYTTSNQNLQLTGGDTVQLIPRKSPSTGQWTSARIESKATFTPAAGQQTLFEASIRFGANPQAQRQGMWPAFWLLGDAIHHGTPWPLCGELDIMETVNGLPTAYGTTHCGNLAAGVGGGPCDEPNGRGRSVALGGDANGWRTWTLLVDRTNKSGGWRGEVIRWMVDGAVFHEVSGADIADEGIWSTLAHSPLFVILNVAVGGSWPGAPNSATTGSYGSMMEVEYVAVYSS